jgi:hypothetical protein
MVAFVTEGTAGVLLIVTVAVMGVPVHVDVEGVIV